VTALPRHRTVGDVMTAHVHVADPRTPFKLLVQIIEENRISAVPIVDSNGMPIGVVSASDLVLKERRTELESGNGPLHMWRPSADQAKAVGVVAADVMTSPAVTVSIDTPIAEAARVMHQRNVRRLVVVDQRLRVAGIVTRSDLLKVFMRTDEDLRGEVSGKLIPAVVPTEVHGVDVEVEAGVVTLSGRLARRTDVEILGRLVRDMDGVVDVVNRLTFRWHDVKGRARAV